MYVQGFVLPVPEGNKDAYRQMAEDEGRETEALAWSEGTLKDVADETR